MRYSHFRGSFQSPRRPHCTPGITLKGKVAMVHWFGVLGFLLALVQMLLRGDFMGEIGLVLSLFVLSVGWIVMGYALWSDKQEALA